MLLSQPQAQISPALQPRCAEALISTQQRAFTWPYPRPYPMETRLPEIRLPEKRPKTKCDLTGAADDITAKLGVLIQDPLMAKFNEELLLCGKIKALRRAVDTSESAKRLISRRLTLAEWMELGTTLTCSPSMEKTIEILIGDKISVVHDTINCMKCFWPLRDLVDYMPSGYAKWALQDLMDSFFDAIY
ncbi:hypothetical protein N7478_002385 [Penicillium angulare]|uniref:uncharacterized protein n=1 Tax=Penicillium angulare TaxID=116970 RepID=UPI002540DB06|nr:uncharacterized protein N7478_002385 [Penicillium angulare]KAJ5286699.1 hypothetical protein N7478_002385 [Penicillium angulare]